jgi:hypothetical protein
VGCTAVLPLSECGVTGHGRDYAVPGSGTRVSDPHIPVAATVFCFGLLGVSKWLAWDLACARQARRRQH